MKALPPTWRHATFSPQNTSIAMPRANPKSTWVDKLSRDLCLVGTAKWSTEVTSVTRSDPMCPHTSHNAV